MNYFQALAASKTGIIVLYLVVINFVGFFSMWHDKRRAVSGAWRTPEARLFLYALLGGSIGSIIGMRVFRHKTKHMSFVIGMPAILILQLAVAVLLKIYVFS